MIIEIVSTLTEDLHVTLSLDISPSLHNILAHHRKIMTFGWKRKTKITSSYSQSPFLLSLDNMDDELVYLQPKIECF